LAQSQGFGLATNDLHRCSQIISVVRSLPGAPLNPSMHHDLKRLPDEKDESSPGFSPFYCMRSRCEIAQQGKRIRICGTLRFLAISVQQRWSAYASEKSFRLLKQDCTLTNKW
jgi:hypothetical protein